MLTKKQLALLRQTPPSEKNRLQAAMDLAGLTQVQLSEHTGFTQGYISRIKNGRYSDDMPGETMRRFAEFFGCAIEDLFPSREAVA